MSQHPSYRKHGRYGQSLPDSCSLYRTPNEDFHHILKYLHPSRSKWRDNLILTLTKLCHSLRTDPTLMAILITGLKSWMSTTPFHQADFPPEYQTLIQEQSSIGWVQFFQGRISLRWAEIQQWHYNGFPKVRGRDGSSWSRKILHHIFTHWNKLWETRNTDLHGLINLRKQEQQKNKLSANLNIFIPSNTKYYNEILTFSRTLMTTTNQDQLTPFVNG